MINKILWYSGIRSFFKLPAGNVIISFHLFLNLIKDLLT